MSLPVTYARWLEELLGEAPPSEPKATCHDCVMCQPDIPPDRAFSTPARCCTYVPRLPNFLVGRLLDDPDPALAPGLKSLKPRLAGPEAHPLGIELSSADSDAYDRLLADENFGQADIRCPHQRDDGLCGIWKHRNGVCATWFCRHERGAVGEGFWDAVQRWLTEIEDALAEFAARAVYQDAGLPVDRAGISEGRWGDWSGSAADFYRACADRIRGLDWRAVRQLGGSKVRKRARRVRRAHRALFDQRLPPRLWLGAHDALEDVGPVRRLMGYCGTDWVAVPGGLDDLLATFDGRRVPEAVSALRAAGCAPTGDLLRAMHDQRVLVGFDPESGE